MSKAHNGPLRLIAVAAVLLLSTISVLVGFRKLATLTQRHTSPPSRGSGSPQEALRASIPGNWRAPLRLIGAMVAIARRVTPDMIAATTADAVTTIPMAGAVVIAATLAMAVMVAITGAAAMVPMAGPAVDGLGTSK
jgi:hypothetical protein